MYNKDDIALSLDMDGYVFNSHYNALRELAQREGPISEEKEIEILYKTNRESFDDLIDIAESAKRVHLILGTGRQDYGMDKDISDLQNTISCFRAIEAITKYFEEKLPDKKVILHKYILADTFGNVDIGTSFDRALEALNGKTVHKHEDTKDDVTKFTLLYSQLNYFANKLKERPFDLWFVDDDDTILIPLHRLFSANTKAIPQTAHLHIKAASYVSRKVTLDSNHHAITEGEHEYVTVDERNPEKIWYYSGNSLNLTSIKGTGDVDPFFEETIRRFSMSETFLKRDLSDNGAEACETINQIRKLMNAPLGSQHLLFKAKTIAEQNQIQSSSEEAVVKTGADTNNYSIGI